MVTPHTSVLVFDFSLWIHTYMLHMSLGIIYEYMFMEDLSQLYTVLHILSEFVKPLLAQGALPPQG